MKAKPSVHLLGPAPTERHEVVRSLLSINFSKKLGKHKLTMSHIWSYDSSSNMHEPKKRFELFARWFGCRRLAILVRSCGACTWRGPGPLKHALLPCRAIAIDKPIHVSSFDLVGWVSTRGACPQQHIPHGQLGKPPWRLGRNGFMNRATLGLCLCVRSIQGPRDSGPYMRYVPSTLSGPHYTAAVCHTLDAQRHHHRVWVSPRAREGIPCQALFLPILTIFSIAFFCILHLRPSLM